MANAMTLATAFIIALCARGLSALSCSPQGCDEAYCNGIVLDDSDWITRSGTLEQRL